MKHKILLIGAGGHCRVVLDLLRHIKGYEVAGIIDLKENLGAKAFGVSVIGTDMDLPHFFKSGINYCFISIGSVGNPHVRIKIFNLAKKIGFVFPNLISSNAKVSSDVILGQGNYVAPGVIINAGASIGNNCIINTGAIAEHDCTLGDFVHLSPGVILSGGVTIGDCAHVGTGSVVIQNLKIGANAMVGAGSVVTKNVRKNMIVYGNPCKGRKKNA